MINIWHKGNTPVVSTTGSGSSSSSATSRGTAGDDGLELGGGSFKTRNERIHFAWLVFSSNEKRDSSCWLLLYIVVVSAKARRSRRFEGGRSKEGGKKKQREVCVVIKITFSKNIKWAPVFKLTLETEERSPLTPTHPHQVGELNCTVAQHAASATKKMSVWQGIALAILKNMASSEAASASSKGLQTTGTVLFY